jgi:hypothetical protein
MLRHDVWVRATVGDTMATEGDTSRAHTTNFRPYIPTHARSHRFFSILPFLINIWEMNPNKSFFSKSDPFGSRQSVRCDLRRSHSSSLGATHFHVDIGCYVNPIDLTITFGIQNDSHHFEWCDSSMSHVTPFGMTDFGSKSAKSVFFIIYCFSRTKNK